MSLMQRISELGDPRELVSRASAFLFVFLLWCAAIWGWWMWRAVRTRRLNTRLGLSEDESGFARELRLWNEGEEFTTVVPTDAVKISLQKRLDEIGTLKGKIDDA